MDLEQVAAVLRPRRSWEGLDLGFALGRTWFRTLWPLWWAGALPAALLGLLASGGRVWLWTLILWWLKPLYEAPLVYWTSRALFGERLSLRHLRPILRGAWTRRILPFLLWRRLSPSRSFGMPIVLLEGLGGPEARQRRRVLSDGAGTAGWLTLACYHFEAILWLGLLLGIYVMVPEELPRLDLEAALTDSDSWAYWVSSLLYVLAMSAIAPFYVCGGFAFYLNRRTELEAWDLDLAFRRVRATPRDNGRGESGQSPSASGARARRLRGASATVLALALALPLALAMPGTETHAADFPDPPQARVLIAEVLAHQDFGRTRTVESWVPIGDDSQSAEPGIAAWIERIGWLLGSVAGLLKWLLLTLAATAVLLLVRRIIRDWQPSRGRRRLQRARAPASRPMEADGEPMSDPETLALGVRACLAAGDRRGALALLYRAGLERLERRGARVPAGATEGECLGLADRYLNPEERGPFRRIAGDWQALAYAQRVPDPESIVARLSDWLDGIAGAQGADVGPGAGATRAG